MGYRYEGEDFEMTVYWQDGYWQTNIPYWGAVTGRCRTDEQRTGSGFNPKVFAENGDDSQQSRIGGYN